MSQINEYGKGVNAREYLEDNGVFLMGGQGVSLVVDVLRPIGARMEQDPGGRWLLVYDRVERATVRDDRGQMIEAFIRLHDADTSASTRKALVRFVERFGCFARCFHEVRTLSGEPSDLLDQSDRAVSDCEEKHEEVEAWALLARQVRSTLLVAATLHSENMPRSSDVRWLRDTPYDVIKRVTPEGGREYKERAAAKASHTMVWWLAQNFGAGSVYISSEVQYTLSGWGITNAVTHGQGLGAMLATQLRTALLSWRGPYVCSLCGAPYSLNGTAGRTRRPPAGKRHFCSDECKWESRLADARKKWDSDHPVHKRTSKHRAAFTKGQRS